MMVYAMAYEAGAVVLLYPGTAPGLSLDQLRIALHGPPLWLVELSLEKLGQVPGALALMIESLREVA